MDNQGRPSRSYKKQTSRVSHARRMTVSMRSKGTSDDDGQSARTPSKSTPSTPGGDPRTGRKQTRDATPQVHRTSSIPSTPSTSQSRMPYTTPSGHHAAERGAPPTPPLSNYSTARRVPPGDPSRSNPIAPVWDAGPSQHRGEPNPRQAPNRGVPYVTAPIATRAPGRKAASGGPPMWDPANEPQSISLGRMIPTPPKKRPPIEISKSTTLPIPFWQHQDAEHEARQKTERRRNKLGDLGHHIPFKQAVVPLSRFYLSPTLRVIQDPPPDPDSDTDGSPMDVDAPPQRSVGVKTTQPQSTQASDLAKGMAARKIKMKSTASQRTPEDSSASSSSQSESDNEFSDSVIELTDTSSEPDETTADKSDIERDPVSENEIIMVEPPQPLITISLPQITPAIPQPPTSLLQSPPDDLITALEEACLSSVRMQQTKQLPFLRRNLRRGFRNRCSAIGIKTSRSKPRIPIHTRYEYMGLTYETHASLWLCPLCELHGAFPNGDLLRLHIQWDHAEIILERWEQRTNNQGKPEWRIQLLVPEIIYEKLQPRTYDFKTEPQEAPISTGTPTPPTRESRPATTPPQSPSPSRTISQTPSRRSQEPSVESLHDVTPVIEQKLNLKKDKALESVTLKPSYSNWKEYASRRAQRPSTAPSGSSRLRSIISTTEATEEPLSTVRIEQTPGPRGGLYPTPPPVEDPLGPAAKFPYLPAKSEYDGPDIYYSCRPIGPSTFDLLGTLPMEPFGVLEWDVLDREEEIYESDDVRVEYKVMHALWLRWMTLNRPLFMQDYYKGVMAFIDTYWRMIHQAAGWRAMRYWLLGLLVHRFLTGREVAKALRHYEDLTGMPYW